MTERESPARHRAGSEYQDIDPAQLPSYQAGARVVDVRELHEFEGPLGRIPGAQLAPLAELLGQAAHWDKDQRVILVCRSGRRSADGATALVANGFQEVFNLRGGMQAYQTTGLAIEYGPCRR